MRQLLLTSALASLLLLAACAGDEDPNTYREVGRGGFGRGGGGDAPPRRQGLQNVFISPAGKPYRAERGQPYPVSTWFALADANHDGKLTLEEFRKDHEAFFRELDTNQDGVVDGFEIQAYENRIAPEILPRIEGLAPGEGMDLTLGQEHRPGDRPVIGSNTQARRNGQARPSPGDRQPEGAGLYGLLNEPEPVAATDTEFNGHITLKEFDAAADRRFAALDAKHLGYLALADLPKTPVQEAIKREAERQAKEAAKKAKAAGKTPTPAAGPPPP
jgi:hypothetical protein